MRDRLFILGISLAVCACGEKKDTFQRTPPPPPVVDVMIAGQQEILATLEVNGSVVADEFVELMPETSGRLVYLNVPEGSYIRKGTVIARINDADLQAQLKKTHVQLEIAELSEQRLKKLLAVNGVNQADYDLALSQVNSLKADMDITSAMIDKTVVKAPFNGTVGLRKISVGALVTTSTVIATMQETNQLKVDFKVPEEYISSVRKGNYVDVKIDKGDGNLQKARIIATEPQVDVTSRNVTVRAVLGKSNVSPGAFAKVYLNMGDARRAVQVPTNCIIPEAKSKMVVLIRNGLPVMADVETGVRQSGLVEVTKGVVPGDTVIVSGMLFARPGKPVRIRSVKPLTELSAEP